MDMTRLASYSTVNKVERYASLIRCWRVVLQGGGGGGGEKSFKRRGRSPYMVSPRRSRSGGQGAALWGSSH